MRTPSKSPGSAPLLTDEETEVQGGKEKDLLGDLLEPCPFSPHTGSTPQSQAVC